ncbi:MAG TPA: prolipoprotein diacylglyceryl transferase [Allosphingosinicella sp.]|nr:prolipoprotein diacylglyceryl transferase [Allosphingosinicella sp.]
MLEAFLTQAGSAIRWDQLGISPVALDLGFFQLKWYPLSYLAMILLGWWYMAKLVAQPGAPLTRRHLESFALTITAGVIVGGRLGYCIFYRPEIWATPLEVLKPWNGGMSLHGGFIGVILAIWLFCRVQKLDMLRVCDYVACASPFGLILVRLANFANGELWGRPTDLPWGMIFPGARDNLPRHPSQLYEALLEGLLMMAVLVYLFWRTDARYRPGRLLGTGLVIYGVARFLIEFVRQPDVGLEHLPLGLTMGQMLSAPMLIAGLYLLVRSGRRDAVTADNRSG